jgi:very-short-patch-repair endonuclease
MAAVLAGGPRATLSHGSAASLWALIAPSGAVEVTRPTKARPRSGIRVHRSLVPADERTVVDGIPVTTMPRTILDLAAVLPGRGLERVMSEAEVLGLTDPLSLPELLARYPRRRGAAALRTVLGDETARRGITRSELEERFVALLDAHLLPRPRLNAHLAVRGRFFEVDCLWEAERLVVELDGHAVHRTGRAFEADRERDRLLLADGWRVTRLTWRQVRDDAAAIAADLRRLLAPAP